MTIDELGCAYTDFCNKSKDCGDCKYNENFPCQLFFGYDKGRADAIDEFIDKVSESIIWDVLAEIMKRNIGASEGADRIIEYLQKIAGQLKEQK